MTEAIGDRPIPEDTWGLEILDPAARFDWVENLWHRIRTDPERRPLLLTYLPSAERATLRSLHIFSRLGREKEYEITYLSVRNIPLLPRDINEVRQLFLVHRASRFLNLNDWLADHGKRSDCLVILTAPDDEVHSLRRYTCFLTTQVPSANAAVAERQAREFLSTLFDSAITDSDFNRFISLLAEIGVAGLEVSIGLLQRALNVTLEEILGFLNRPEVCDLIRLSPRGPLEERVVSFRGTWLAESVVPTAKANGYPALEALIKAIDPESCCDCRFLLNYLIALRVQGSDSTIIRIRKKWDDKISRCRSAAKKRECVAWFLFFHHGLLNFTHIIYLIKKRIRLILTYHPGLFDFDFSIKQRLSL